MNLRYGTLNANSARFTLSAHSSITMTVFDTEIFNSSLRYEGYRSDKSRSTSFPIEGGTATGSNLFLSNPWHNLSSAAPSGIRTMTMTGGSATFTDTYRLWQRRWNIGGEGALNREGDALLLSSVVVVGHRTKEIGTAGSGEWNIYV